MRYKPLSHTWEEAMKDVMENDALTLEYKLYERDTFRHLRIADIMNNAAGLGLIGAKEVGLEEKIVRFVGGNLGAPNNDLGD